MMFLDCPAYLDHDRTVRCGLPAEARCRFTMRSTGGPLESAMIRRPAGHYFSGPIESLTWESSQKHAPGQAGVAASARPDCRLVTQDGRDGGGGSDLRDYPAQPERTGRRPNTAPAYYLGRPARLWITVVRPRRRRTAARHPVLAAAGLPLAGADAITTLRCQQASRPEDRIWQTPRNQIPAA